MDLNHIPPHLAEFKEHERVIFIHDNQVKTGFVIRDNGELGDVDISTSPSYWVRIEKENVRLATAKNLRMVAKPVLPIVAKPTGIQAQPERTELLVTTYERIQTPVGGGAYSLNK